MRNRNTTRHIRLLSLSLFALILASCVPANVPDEAVLASGRQASWRTDWTTTAVEAVGLPARLAPVFEGLARPTAITGTSDGTGGLFVAEQEGRVLRLRPGDTEAVTVLDLSERIACCGERGLLGVATHPDFARTGLLYVHYTDPNGSTVVSEFATTAGTADTATERVLFTVEQPGIAHNGGQLAFGPNGWLHFSLGDGMYSPIPLRRAQDPETPYGSIMRLLPDAPDSAEAVALGLRNPWRFSFDRDSGDIWIADVGQSGYEEINRIPAGERGLNFGWPDVEGYSCLTTMARCENSGYSLPVLAYDHSEGCSVTGGYVYRGSLVPELVGHYLYSDFCAGTIWAVNAAGGDNQPRVVFDSSLNVTTFGEDDQGELYVADFGLGTLYQLVPLVADSTAE